MIIPTIAAVVTTWNSAATVEAAIASILNQIQLPQRLIVVDAGSTDDTLKVVRSALLRTPIESQVIELGSNGPSAARNAGWRAAAAQWIQFLDADDVLAPEKLRVQSAHAMKVSKDVAVIHAPFQRTRLVHGAWRPLGSVTSAKLGGNQVAALFRAEGFFNVGAALFNAEWLTRVGGFDERYSLLEDVHCYLRIARAGGRFEPSPGSVPLLEFRQRDDSLSRRTAASFAEAVARNAAVVDAHYAGSNDMPDEIAREVALRYWQAAYLSPDRPQMFADLVKRAAHVDRTPRHYPPRKFRMALSVLGPQLTARGISLFRQARRSVGIGDTR